MTKESQAVVQRVRFLNTHYQQLELATDHLGDMKPGQVMLTRPKALRITQTWNPYLRDVWHPVHVSKNKVTVEVHTERTYQPGDVMDVIAPVGQHFRFRSALRNVLLLAYDTAPSPLMMTIPWLVANQISVTLVLVGGALNYPTTHLPPEVEIIRGEAGDSLLDWPNQVTTIGWADQVFVVVPPHNEMAAFTQVWELFNQRRADIGKNYLFGVFQNLIPCGVGACHACMVRTTDGAKLACVDGPAFDLKQILF